MIVSLAIAKKISLDAAVAAVFLELEGTISYEEKTRTWHWRLFFFFLPENILSITPKWLWHQNAKLLAKSSVTCMQEASSCACLAVKKIWLVLLNVSPLPNLASCSQTLSMGSFPRCVCEINLKGFQKRSIFCARPLLHYLVTTCKCGGITSRRVGDLLCCSSDTDNIYCIM